MTEEKMYSTTEVAKELCISDARVRRLIATGKAYPKLKIGGVWIFSQAELDRLRNRSKLKGGRPKKGPTVDINAV